MLRRGFSNDNTSLPTHGGVGGYSSPTNDYGSASGSMYSAGQGQSSKYDKRRDGGSSSLLTFGVIITTLLNLLFTGLWVSSKGRYRSLLDQVNARDAQGAIEKVRWTEEELSKIQHETYTKTKEAELQRAPTRNRLERENNDLRRERDDLRERYESIEKKEEDSRMKNREPAHLKQIDLLQTAIRKESRRTVLERFGPSPHEVRMTYSQNNVDYSFVIEMAPLDTTPHAIHLFLEQVEHGLWNDTYFYINTPHVLQAGPSYPGGIRDPAIAAGEVGNIQRFEDARLDQLAFPDYSNEFPHLKWTVGFAGRPGGPDFYINKEENIQIHGPGGQIQHAIDEQGDSCFGRITQGFEDIERILFVQPVEESGEFIDFIEHQVHIKSAIILNPKPNVGGGSLTDFQEIPESAEIQFGRSLDQALNSNAQNPIEEKRAEVRTPDEPIENSNTNEVESSQSENQPAETGHDEGITENESMEVRPSDDHSNNEIQQEKQTESGERIQEEEQKEGFVLGADGMDFGEDY